MNATKRLGGKLGIVLFSALLGCTTQGQPSVSVGVSVALPSVEIHADSDFYEPLTPYGRWEVVGSYGRCWIPGGVEADWRPYCNGNWQRTDAGWYWASDEPWGWATYHYGRWDLSPEYGWYWVPQTQWAPAWVSWHSGGGYIGWAPLYPSDVRVISPRAYVFVEERHFMEPVRRSTLVVNNTIIINKTVINQGPATALIEKTSGRKVQAVPVRDLRNKEEAPVIARHAAPASGGEKKVPTPIRNDAQPAEKKAMAAAPHELAAPAPKNSEGQSGRQKPVLVTAESKPAVRPETRPEGNHPVAIKEPTRQEANPQPVKQVKPARPANQKIQQPVQEKSSANENGTNPADKDRENKPKE